MDSVKIECLDCKVIPFIDDASGSIVCRNCGLVIVDQFPSDENEWRNFNNSEKDNSRVGAPSSFSFLKKDNAMNMIQSFVFDFDRIQPHCDGDILKAWFNLSIDTYSQRRFIKRINGKKTNKRNLAACCLIQSAKKLGVSMPILDTKVAIERFIMDAFQIKRLENLFFDPMSTSDTSARELIIDCFNNLFKQISDNIDKNVKNTSVDLSPLKYSREEITSLKKEALDKFNLLHFDFEAPMNKIAAAVVLKTIEDDHKDFQKKENEYKNTLCQNVQNQLVDKRMERIKQQHKVFDSFKSHIGPSKFNTFKSSLKEYLPYCPTICKFISMHFNIGEKTFLTFYNNFKNAKSIY